ncbi:hypothetical protein GCM10023321_73120 [Pseudonocardia eucalypti]|uniref:Major facilitator superfamily (MFS) profile domain-containing protein n=1 Tax=Pseudonocardia eucalypti TaxID=648755 RepID=A0ABP9R8M9_9PSEU
MGLFVFGGMTVGALVGAVLVTAGLGTVSMAVAGPGRLRPILTTVASSDGGVTRHELVEAHPGFAPHTLDNRLLMLRLAGLIVRVAERLPSGGWRVRFQASERLPEVMGYLDDPNSYPADRSREALDSVRRWLAPGTEFAPTELPVQEIAEAVREVLGLAPAPPADNLVPANSVRALLDALADHPGGMSSAELAELLPALNDQAITRWVATLTRLGLVWWVDNRYLLPEHILVLLATVDDPVDHHDEDLDVVWAFGALLAGPVTKEYLDAEPILDLLLRRIARIDNGPLAGTLRLAPASSAGRMLLAIPGPGTGGIARDELAALPGAAPLSRLDSRLPMLVTLGMLDATKANSRRGLAKRYSTTEFGQLLHDALEELHHHLNPDTYVKLWRLTGMLRDGGLTLSRRLATTGAFIALVTELRAILGAEPPALDDGAADGSVWALLHRVASAPEGITGEGAEAEWLEELAELRLLTRTEGADGIRYRATVSTRELLGDLADPARIGHAGYREAVTRFAALAARQATPGAVAAGVAALRHPADPRLTRLLTLPAKAPLSFLREFTADAGGTTATALTQRLRGYSYQVVSGQLVVVWHLGLAHRESETRGETNIFVAHDYAPTAIATRVVAALNNPRTIPDEATRRVLGQARAVLSNGRSFTQYYKGANQFEDVLRAVLAALGLGDDRRGGTTGTGMIAIGPLGVVVSQLDLPAWAGPAVLVVAGAFVLGGALVAVPAFRGWLGIAWRLARDGYRSVAGGGATVSVARLISELVVRLTEAKSAVDLYTNPEIGEVRDTAALRRDALTALELLAETISELRAAVASRKPGGAVGDKAREVTDLAEIAHRQLLGRVKPGAGADSVLGRAIDVLRFAADRVRRAAYLAHQPDDAVRELNAVLMDLIAYRYAVTNSNEPNRAVLEDLLKGAIKRIDTLLEAVIELRDLVGEQSLAGTFEEGAYEQANGLVELGTFASRILDNPDLRVTPEGLAEDRPEKAREDDTGTAAEDAGSAAEGRVSIEDNAEVNTGWLWLGAGLGMLAGGALAVWLGPAVLWVSAGAWAAAAVVRHRRQPAARVVLYVFGGAALGAFLALAGMPEVAAAAVVGAPRVGLPLRGVTGLTELTVLDASKKLPNGEWQVMAGRDSGGRLVVLRSRNVAVKLPRDRAALVPSVSAAAVHAIAGTDAAAASLGVVLEDMFGKTPDGNQRLLRAGQVVEVNELEPGGMPVPVELGQAPLDRFARHFGVFVLLGEIDGLWPINLILEPERQVIHPVDFANSMSSMVPWVAFLTTLNAGAWAFGRLTEEDILVQFADLVDQRDRILGVLPNERLRKIADERLDWMAERVTGAAGGLAGWLRTSLDRVRGEFVRANPDYQPPAEGFQLPATTGDPWTEAFLASHRASGVSGYATGGQLRRFVAAGHRVWVHDHAGGDRWLVTVAWGKATQGRVTLSAGAALANLARWLAGLARAAPWWLGPVIGFALVLLAPVLLPTNPEIAQAMVGGGALFGMRERFQRAVQDRAEDTTVDADLRLHTRVAEALVEHLAHQPEQTAALDELVTALGGDAEARSAVRGAVEVDPRLRRDATTAWLVPTAPTGGPEPSGDAQPFEERATRPFKPTDSLARQVFAAIDEFARYALELPIAEEDRAILLDLLAWVREHPSWAIDGRSSWVDVVGTRPGTELPDVRLVVSHGAVLRYSKDLGRVLRALGVPPRVKLIPLAARFVVWHELTHVLQIAYDHRTGSSELALASEALRREIAPKLDLPLGGLTTPEWLETERQAHGLAALLITRHLLETVELTELQAQYLPTVLRSVLGDMRYAEFVANRADNPLGGPTPSSPGLPGYLYYYDERQTLASLALTQAGGAGGAVVANMTGEQLAAALPKSERDRLARNSEPMDKQRFSRLAEPVLAPDGSGVDLNDLVEIVNEAPLGGRLKGFGFRPRGAAPAQGKILVPRHVIELVDRLVGLNSEFRGWWVAFLHHEWRFHIARDEHTGPDHDHDNDLLIAWLHREIARRAPVLAEVPWGPDRADRLAFLFTRADPREPTGAERAVLPPGLEVLPVGRDLATAVTGLVAITWAPDGARNGYPVVPEPLVTETLGIIALAEAVLPSEEAEWVRADVRAFWAGVADHVLLFHTVGFDDSELHGASVDRPILLTRLRQLRVDHFILMAQVVATLVEAITVSQEAAPDRVELERLRTVLPEVEALFRRWLAEAPGPAAGELDTLLWNALLWDLQLWVEIAAETQTRYVVTGELGQRLAELTDGVDPVVLDMLERIAGVADRFGPAPGADPLVWADDALRVLRRLREEVRGRQIRLAEFKRTLLLELRTGTPDTGAAFEDVARANEVLLTVTVLLGPGRPTTPERLLQVLYDAALLIDTADRLVAGHREHPEAGRISAIADELRTAVADEHDRLDPANGRGLADRLIAVLARQRDRTAPLDRLAWLLRADLLDLVDAVDSRPSVLELDQTAPGVFVVRLREPGAGPGLLGGGAVVIGVGLAGASALTAATAKPARAEETGSTQAGGASHGDAGLFVVVVVGALLAVAASRWSARGVALISGEGKGWTARGPPPLMAGLDRWAIAALGLVGMHELGQLAALAPFGLLVVAALVKRFAPKLAGRPVVAAALLLAGKIGFPLLVGAAVGATLFHGGETIGLMGLLTPANARAVLPRGALAEHMRAGEDELAGVAGLLLVDDLPERVTAIGGPRGVWHYRHLGWIYLDTGMYGSLPEDALQAVLWHETLRVQRPGWPDSLVGQYAPLPDLTDAKPGSYRLLPAQSSRLGTNQVRAVGEVVERYSNPLRDPRIRREVAAAPGDIVHARWMKKIIGFTLEELARPVMERLANSNNEFVLKNVRVRMVTGSGEPVAEVAEFDYLFFDEFGLVRYVAVKSRANKFKLYRERERLATLFGGLPPERAGQATGLEVSWEGAGDWIPLSEFRADYLGERDIADVPIEKLTPRGESGAHHVDLTRAELHREVVLAVLRAIAAVETAERAQGMPGTAGTARTSPGLPRGGALFGRIAATVGALPMPHNGGALWHHAELAAGGGSEIFDFGDSSTLFVVHIVAVGLAGMALFAIGERWSHPEWRESAKRAGHIIGPGLVFLPIALHSLAAVPLGLGLASGYAVVSVALLAIGTGTTRAARTTAWVIIAVVTATIPTLLFNANAWRFGLLTPVSAADVQITAHDWLGRWPTDGRVVAMAVGALVVAGVLFVVLGRWAINRRGPPPTDEDRLEQIGGDQRDAIWAVYLRVQGATRQANISSPSLDALGRDLRDITAHASEVGEDWVDRLATADELFAVLNELRWLTDASRESLGTAESWARAYDMLTRLARLDPGDWSLTDKRAAELLLIALTRPITTAGGVSAGRQTGHPTRRAGFAGDWTFLNQPPDWLPHHIPWRQLDLVERLTLAVLPVVGLRDPTNGLSPRLLTGLDRPRGAEDALFEVRTALRNARPDGNNPPSTYDGVLTLIETGLWLNQLDRLTDRDTTYTSTHYLYDYLRATHAELRTAYLADDSATREADPAQTDASQAGATDADPAAGTRAGSTRTGAGEAGMGQTGSQRVDLGRQAVARVLRLLGFSLLLGVVAVALLLTHPGIAAAVAVPPTGNRARPHSRWVIKDEREGEAELFAEVLRGLERLGHVRQQERDPNRARAPTAVLELPSTYRVRELLEEGGLAEDFPERMVGFFWAERDLIVVFEPMAEHVKARGLWQRLLDALSSKRGDDADEIVRQVFLIRPHTYRPAPRMRGTGPLFLGFELEINVPKELVREAAELVQRRLGDLVYLKRDRDIASGFEIVAHPMSYEWAMAHFPWDIFDELAALGADPGDLGLHVHISRDGFSSWEHAWAWMEFIHRNREPVVALARRESEHAAFTEKDRRNLKLYAQGVGTVKYRAINTQPADTYELRVFASTLVLDELQAALGLAEASVEYTRPLSVDDVRGETGEWSRFAAWVRARPPYAPLAREIARRTATDAGGPRSGGHRPGTMPGGWIGRLMLALLAAPVLVALGAVPAWASTGSPIGGFDVPVAAMVALGAIGVGVLVVLHYAIWRNAPPRARVEAERAAKGPLGVRNSRLLLGGQLISFTGSGMQNVAFGLLVFELSGRSGTAFGLVLGTHAIPAVLSLVGGAFADRFDKRRLLSITYTGMALVAVVLGVLATGVTTELWPVFVLAFLHGALVAINMPIQQVFGVSVVGKRHLARAIGLTAIAANVGLLAGPALATVLVGVVGIAPMFWLNAASFLAPLTALALMDRGQLHAPETTDRASSREALRYVRGHAVVLTVLTVAAVVAATAQNTEVTVPLLALHGLGGDGADYGTLLAAAAIGTLLGAVLSALRHGKPHLRTVLGGAVLLGLLHVVAGFAPSEHAAALVLMVAGLVAMFYATGISAYLQLSVEPAVRGRVMGLYSMLLYVFDPVSSPLFGAAGDHFGGRSPIQLAGAIGALAAVAAVAVLLRPRDVVRMIGEYRVGWVFVRHRAVELRIDNPGLTRIGNLERILELTERYQRVGDRVVKVEKLGVLAALPVVNRWLDRAAKRRVVLVLLEVAVVSVALLHVVGIGYAKPTVMVSEYVAAPGGVVLLALAMAPTAVAVELVARFVDRADLGRLTVRLLRVAGVALAVMAAFPTTPFGVALDWPAQVHRWAAVVLFISLPWAAIRLAIALPAVRALRASVWTFVGFGAATAVSKVLDPVLGDLPWLLSTGILERIALGAGVVVLALVAGRLGAGVWSVGRVGHSGELVGRARALAGRVGLDRLAAGAGFAGAFAFGQAAVVGAFVLLIGAWLVHHWFPGLARQPAVARALRLIGEFGIPLLLGAAAGVVLFHPGGIAVAAVVSPFGPHSGGVIRDERPGERALFVNVLRRLRGLGEERQQRRDANRERAPPAVLELPVNDEVRALLAEGGLAEDFPERMVGFFWAEEDLNVVFTPMAERVRAAGLWKRLMHNAEFFHRAGNRAGINDFGFDYDSDADDIVGLLFGLDRPRPSPARPLVGLPLEMLDIAAIDEIVESDRKVDGKPKTMQVRDGADRALWIKQAPAGERHRLVDWVVASLALRIFGVPVPASWLAVAAHDVTPSGTGKPVVFAGDVVLVQQALPGEAPTHDQWMNWRHHLAGRLGAALTIRDWDGIRRHNLMVDPANPQAPPAQFDFDKAMDAHPWNRTAEAGSIINLEGKVFGLLTEQHVLALLAQALALREPLLAAMPNERLREQVAVGLLWMADVLANDRLPDEVARRLTSARRSAARVGSETDGGYHPLEPPANPGVPQALPGGTRQALGPVDLAEARAEGHDVRVHDPLPDGRWDVTITPGATRGGGTETGPASGNPGIDGPAIETIGDLFAALTGESGSSAYDLQPRTDLSVRQMTARLEYLVRLGLAVKQAGRGYGARNTYRLSRYGQNVLRDWRNLGGIEEAEYREALEPLGRLPIGHSFDSALSQLAFPLSPVQETVLRVIGYSAGIHLGNLMRATGRFDLRPELAELVDRELVRARGGVTRGSYTLTHFGRRALEAADARNARSAVQPDPDDEPFRVGGVVSVVAEGEGTGGIGVTYRELTDITGLSSTQLDRLLRVLVGHGVMTKGRRHGPIRRQPPNAYTLSAAGKTLLADQRRRPVQDPDYDAALERLSEAFAAPAKPLRKHVLDDLAEVLTDLRAIPASPLYDGDGGPGGSSSTGGGSGGPGAGTGGAGAGATRPGDPASRAWTALPAPGQRNHGAVIANEREGELDRFADLVPKLAKHGVELEQERGPGRPRAPPKNLVLPVNEAVQMLLRDADLADFPVRLFEYYWPDRDLMVVFEGMRERITAAGLWPRLLHHVEFFHRHGILYARNHLGLTHDEDAEEIVRSVFFNGPRSAEDVALVEAVETVVRRYAPTGEPESADAALELGFGVASALVEDVRAQPGRARPVLWLFALLGGSPRAANLLDRAIAVDPRLRLSPDGGAVWFVPAEPVGGPAPIVAWAEPTDEAGTAERITESDPLGARVLALIRDFPNRVAGLPLDGGTRAELAGFVPSVEANAYWSAGLQSSVDTSRTSAGKPTLTLRVSRTMPGLLAEDIHAAFARLGHPITAEEAHDLGLRLLLWHKLTHVMEKAYGVALGGRLGADTFAAGLSSAFAIPLGGLTNAAHLEDERFAHGMAMLLLLEHILARHPELTATQRRYLPDVMRSVHTDSMHAGARNRHGGPTSENTGLPGYLYYHPAPVVLAILGWLTRVTRSAYEPLRLADPSAIAGMPGVRPELEFIHWARELTADPRFEPNADFWARVSEAFAGLAEIPDAPVGGLRAQQLELLFDLLDRFGPDAEMPFGATPSAVAESLGEMPVPAWFDAHYLDRPGVDQRVLAYRDLIDELRYSERFREGWRELLTALIETTRGAGPPSPRAVRGLLTGMVARVKATGEEETQHQLIADATEAVRALGGGTGRHPNAGGVIINERRGERDRILRVLPELKEHGKVREARKDPNQARAPPDVLELPVKRKVRKLLRKAGLADLPRRMIDIYWPDEDLLVVFKPMAKRVRAAGLWDRVAEHVEFFHRGGNPHGTNKHGLDHDQDADDIIRLLHDFQRLRRGKAISDGGSAVSTVVLPLMATGMGANPFEVSLLATLTYGASVVFGLPAGWIAARVPKRPLMIGVDLARFVLVASVPVAVLFGGPTMVQLYVVAGATGALFIVYAVASGAYVPELVGPRQVPAANASLVTASSTAQSAGPAIGGGLVGAIDLVTTPVQAAAATQGLDALSYLVNVKMLTDIETPDTPLPPRKASVRKGLSLLFGDSVLRGLALFDGFARFFLGAIFAVQTPYLVNELKLPGWSVGAVATVMFLGGWLAARWANSLAERYGPSRVLWVSPLVAAPVALAIYPFAPVDWGGLAMAASGLTAVTAMTRVRQAISDTVLQLNVSPELLSQAFAANRWVGNFGAPFGAAFGGALATWMGMREAAAVVLVGVGVAAVVFLVLSPLRGAKTYEDISDVIQRRRGGAVMIELSTGRPMPQRHHQYAAARTSIAELMVEQRPEPLGPGDPEYELADPLGRWARHRVPMYVLTGLNRRYALREWRLGSERTGLVMFVAPGPDGRLAVFVDPLTLARLRTLSETERAQLAERELARILHEDWSEQRIQRMVLPAPERLRELVTESDLGSPALGNPVELAVAVIDHLDTRPGGSASRRRLSAHFGVDADTLDAALLLHPRLWPDENPAPPQLHPRLWQEPADPTARLLPAGPVVIPASRKRGRALEPDPDRPIVRIANRITDRGGPAGTVHDAIDLFPALIDELELHLDPATRARLVALLEHIRAHSYWAPDDGPSEVRRGADGWEMLLTRADVKFNAGHLRQAFGLLNHPITPRQEARLGIFELVWHELAHVLQVAHGEAAGTTHDALALAAFATGRTTPLIQEPNPYTSAVLVENERFAEGLAQLLLTRYSGDRFMGSRWQAHYLPAVLRSVKIDAFGYGGPHSAPLPDNPELPGYQHFHDEPTVRAILAAHRQALAGWSPRGPPHWSWRYGDAPLGGAS